MKYDIVACPFCHEAEIQIRVYGGVWQERVGSRTALGKTKSVRKSATTFIVEHDCPRCGKTADEIEGIL